ncbi:MAG: hypothetical protein MJ249_04750 [Kiritimatiellae bacterium]|nr:hypothetical protein [Kiritimatiellia bacterium]
MLIAGFTLLGGLLAGAETALPGEYVSLEWIRSTGTEYINTDYIHDASTKVTCDVKVDASQPSTWSGVFGARNSSYVRNAFVFFAKSGKTNSLPVFNRSGIEDFADPFVFGVRTTIVCDGREAAWSTADGPVGTVTATGKVDSGANTMLIFNLNTAGIQGVTPDSSWCRMTLYSFRIEDAQGLQRDFVPCRRRLDGAAGLFDRVSGKFFANCGTGRFIGSDEGEAWVNYAVSDGRQKVRTDYTMDDDTTVFFDFGRPVYANSTAFFGLKWSSSCYLFNQQSNRFYFHSAGDIFTTMDPADGTSRYTFTVDDSNMATLRNLTTGTSQSLLVSRSVANSTADPILAIFSDNAGGHQSSFRFYGMDIDHAEGAMTRTLVPQRRLRAARDANARVGVRDEMTGAFYPNTGTAELGYGYAFQPTENGFEVLDGTAEADDALAGTNVVKRSAGTLNAGAVANYKSFNLAEGTLSLADGAARTTTVAGTLTLAGGAWLFFDVTAEGCDKLQTGTVDLSGASAANPVTVSLVCAADAAFGTDGKLTLVSGGLAAGDAAKFQAVGFPVTLAVEGGALVATASRSVPMTARWIGGGDRTRANDPANWACTDITGAPIAGAIPTAETTIVLESPTTFNFPADSAVPYRALRVEGNALELAAAGDWRGLDLAALPAGLALDLKGFGLKLNWNRTPTGALSIANSAAAAELVLTVPKATGTANGAATFTGALALVKDGEGSFMWTTGKLAADIPITVTNGVFRNGYTANNTASKDVLGAGGTITVKGKGQFDLNYGAGGVAPTYNREFRLEGEGPDGEGALVNFNSSTSNGNHLNQVKLTGDATLGGSTRLDFRGKGPRLDGPDYTLTIKNTSVVAFCAGDATLNVKKVVVTNGGIFQPCSDGCVINIGEGGVELCNGGVYSSWSAKNVTYTLNTPIHTGLGGGEINSLNYWFSQQGAVTVNPGTTLSIGNNGGWYSAITNSANGTLRIGETAKGAVTTGAWLRDCGIFVNNGLVEQVAGELSLGKDASPCLEAVNAGTIRTRGGTFFVQADTALSGNGVLDLGATSTVNCSLAAYGGTIRLSGGTAAFTQIGTFTGSLVLSDGTLNSDLAAFPGTLVVDLSDKVGVFDLSTRNWPEKTVSDQRVVVNVGARDVVIGEKLMSWQTTPAWQFVFDNDHSSVTPYVAADGLYYGYSEDSTYVTSARWTGAAGNGDFGDPDNWSCFNVANREVPNGLPLDRTPIVLEADATGGWTAFNAEAFKGTIDLNGHALSLYGFNGTSATACQVTDSSTGERGEVRFTIGAGTNYVHKTMPITGNVRVVKDGDGTLTWGGGTLAADIPLLITNGVFKLGINTANAFGTSGTVTIANKGQLDTANMGVGSMVNRTFYVEGEGPDGRGAMLNSANTTINMKTMILTGDATLGGVGRFDFRASSVGGTCSLHGEDYTLTIKNTTCLAFCGGNSSLYVNRVVVADGGYFQPCSDSTGQFSIAAGNVDLVNGGKLAMWNGNSKTVFTVPVSVTVGEGGGFILSDANAYNLTGSVHVTNGGTLTIGKNTGTIAELVVDEGCTVAMPTGAGTFTVGGTCTNAGTIEQNVGTLTIGGNTSAAVLANTGLFRVTGGTCTLSQGCTVTGNGTFDFAGGTVKVSADITGARGAIRVGTATVTVDYINQFMGKLVFVDGTFNPNLTGFAGEIVLDIAARNEPFVIDQHNWCAFLMGRAVTVNLAGRELTLGDKLIHWSTSPNATYAFDAETATAGITPYTTATGLFYGADPDSPDAATATWTAAAGSGQFLDAGNWTCYNAAKRMIPNGVPRADTLITLAADVPDGAWRDFVADAYVGSIDMAGHALTLYGKHGANITAFSVTSSGRSDPAPLTYNIDEGIAYVNQTVTFGGNISFIKQGAGSFTWGGGTLAAAIPIVVSNGVFKLGIATPNALGNGGTVTIGGQGQMDLNITATTGQSPVFSRTFYIAGEGPDGSGAIVNNGPKGRCGNHLKMVYLTDDATIGGVARIDFRGKNPNPTLDCGNHTLTIKNKELIAFCAGAATLRGKHVVITDGGALEPCSDGCVIQVTDPIEVKNGGIFGSWSAKNVTYQYNIPVTVSEGSNTIRSDAYWFNNSGMVTVNVGAELSLGNEGGWYKNVVNHGTLKIGSSASNAWLRNYDWSNKQPGTLLNDGLIIHTAGILALGSDQNATWKSATVNDGTIRTSGGTFIINAASSMSGTGTLELIGGTPQINGSFEGFSGEVWVTGGEPKFNSVETFSGTLRLVDGVMTNTPLASFRGTTIYDLKSRETLPFDIEGKGWTDLPQGTRVIVETGDRRFHTGDKVVSWETKPENLSGLSFKLASGQPGALVGTDKGVVFMTGLTIILH